MPTMTSTTFPEHSNIVSGPTISKGTEILCFASIIPALAIIFYLSSRIMRGSSTRKMNETLGNSASCAAKVQKIQSHPTPNTAAALLTHPEPTHLAKKESKIQDLRRYFGSPTSSNLPQPAYKPFLNHRCSISLKDSAITKSRRSFRPLSLLSVIKKKQVKGQITNTTHPSPGSPDSDRKSAIRLWQIAGFVVGTHPQAKPLHARLPGRTLSSKDCRVVSDLGFEISWYNPPDKASSIIVPAISRGTSGKTFTKAIKPEESSAPDPPNSIISANVVPSRIPVVKYHTCSQINTDSDALSRSPIRSPLPLDLISSKRMPSCSQVNVESSSSPLSFGASDQAISGMSVSDGSDLNASKRPDIGPAQIVGTTLDTNLKQNSRPKTKAIPWEERMPGLVTVSPPTSSQSSETQSQLSATKSRHLKSCQSQKREFKVITNLGSIESQMARLPNVKKLPPGQMSGGVTIQTAEFTSGLHARLRATRHRKLTPEGKENVSVAGTAF